MRRPLSVLDSLVAAALLLGAATPAFSRGANCLFGITQPLSFGSLDPSAAVRQDWTVAIEVGDCQGGSVGVFTVTVDSIGSPGAPRMYLNGVVGAADFVSYSLGPVTLDANTAPGNDNYRTAKFTGTVLPDAYANARAGTYRDTVRVTLNY